MQITFDKRASRRGSSGVLERGTQRPSRQRPSLAFHTTSYMEDRTDVRQPKQDKANHQLGNRPPGLPSHGGTTTRFVSGHGNVLVSGLASPQLVSPELKPDGGWTTTATVSAARPKTYAEVLAVTLASVVGEARGHVVWEPEESASRPVAGSLAEVGAEVELETGRQP